MINHKISQKLDKTHRLSLNAIFWKAETFWFFGLPVIQCKQQNQEKTSLNDFRRQKKVSKDVLMLRIQLIIWSKSVQFWAKNVTCCSFWFLSSVKIMKNWKKLKFQCLMILHKKNRSIQTLKETDRRENLVKKDVKKT